MTEVEAEQPIEALRHCYLRDAQLNDLIEQIRYKVPAIPSEDAESLLDTKDRPAFPAAICLENMPDHTPLQTVPTEDDVLDDFGYLRSF